MNRHPRAATSRAGQRGILIAGALALVIITGCGPTVSVRSPIPTNGEAPAASTAAQTPVATPPPTLASMPAAPATSKVVAIAVGNDHACALTSVGGVKCWGANEYGELGNGSTDHTSHPIPSDVSGLTSGVTALAAGDFGACAVVGGGVKCWGRNNHGQLGNGTTIDSDMPVGVTGLTSGVVALAMGETHTCAMTAGGGVTCWGWNQSGALGNGSTIESSTPVPVMGLTHGVTAVAVGQTHSCALTSGGAVKCWGFSEALGNGSFGIDSHTPVGVTGLASGVTAISAGGNHTCAVLHGGGVTCWGVNFYGQLGIGSTVAGTSTPVGVVGLPSSVTAIAAGEEDTCALTGGGAVRCWGYNAAGQLGDGKTTNSTRPVVVTGLAGGVTAVAAGVILTCALMSTGGVKCWGDNGAGELGDGSTIGSPIPVGVAGL